MSVKQDQSCWREHINNIEKMRRERNAPVDSMGCEQICDRSAPPEVSIALFVTLSFDMIMGARRLAPWKRTVIPSV